MMRTSSSTNGRPKVSQTDLGVYLEERVYPALYQRLDSAFPEYGWRSSGGGAMVATSWPGELPFAVEHQHPDRLVCYAGTPWQVMVHGHGPVRWLDYVSGGSKPTGPDFLKCVRDLCDRAGVSFPELQMTEEERERARRWEERRTVLAAVLGSCQEALWADAGRAARDYMHGRGFAEDDLRALGVGYYDSAGRIRSLLRKEGYDTQAAQDAALLWERLDGYAVLPWSDAAGGVLTLYGRWPGPLPPMKDLPAWRRKRDELRAAWELKPREEQAAAPWVEPTIPKTIALPGDGTKGVPLFFDRALRAGHRDTIVGVEGVLDGAMAQCRGDTRVVAYVGASFTQQQIEALARHNVRSVIIAPDPDGGGDRGACSSVQRLTARGIAAYVARRLPDGLDPDEYILRNGIEAWRRHLDDPIPGIVYRVGQVLGDVTPESPEIRRRKVADEAVAVAFAAADERDRTAALKLIAERTGYRVADLKKGRAKAQAGGDGREKRRGKGAVVKPAGEAAKAEGGAGRKRQFRIEYGDPDGFLVLFAEDRDGTPVVKPIANFTARIPREYLRHASGKVVRQYLIEAVHVKGMRASAVIDAADYAKAGVGGTLGADFAVAAKCDGHVRAAIQFLSSAEGIARTEVYGHTGWVEHRGRMGYCHAGGVITADGPIGTVVVEEGGQRRYEEASQDEILVELDPALGKYRLPDPPLDPERRGIAIRASLGLLRLGRHSSPDAPRRPNAQGIAAVLAGLPYRAVLRQNPGTVHFVGGTGARKTTAACLPLQHFAPGHSHDQPVPVTWDATANFLQGVLHNAKESLVLVDELVADGPDAEKCLAKASGVISAQGNASGRRRMRQDLSLAPSMDPRGTLLGTGETVPSRRSALGRSLVVRFTPEAGKTPGSIDLEALTACQRDAEAGLYAEAMACYIQHLAGGLDAALARHKKLSEDLRGEAMVQASGAHPRCARIVAELGAAFRMFVGFAVEQGAIGQQEGDALIGEQWAGLLSLLADQAKAQEETDPARRFLALLSSVLSSGRAHLASPTGTAPPGCESACGWVRGREGVWDPAQPSAPKVGWTDGKWIYLNRESAMAAVQRLAVDQRHPLGEPGPVWSRLAEAGVLTPSTRGGKTRYDVRKVLEGQQQTVAKILADAPWHDRDSGEADDEEDEVPELAGVGAEEGWTPDY